MCSWVWFSLSLSLSLLCVRACVVLGMCVNIYVWGCVCVGAHVDTSYAGEFGATFVVTSNGGLLKQWDGTGVHPRLLYCCCTVAVHIVRGW
eukprot:m.267459 g.267459  ORF g.267459 m.267459 type:complete len:91 (-) comp19733_c0_seq4:1311-1583(-)